jgi:hypothetical protein
MKSRFSPAILLKFFPAPGAVSLADRAASPLPRFLTLWLFAVVICKLALVSHEEILAFNLPHDDLWQIRAADRWVWSGGYHWDTLIHDPLYPLFICLFNAFGIPLRLATDALLCGASCLLARALWQTGYSSVTVGLAAFAAMFHPASFQLPNRAGAEVFLAPFLLGAVSTSLVWWNQRDGTLVWRQALHAAFWWAIAWNLRSESILIAGSIGFFAVIIALQDRQGGLRLVAKRVFLGAVLPASFAIALSGAIKTTNYFCWHLYARSILTAPGFESAYKALQSIPPPEVLPHVHVTAAARAQAYAVSPTFSELRPHLEGPTGAGWANTARPYFMGWLGPKCPPLGTYEIPAGFFHWALHDAAIAAGHGATPHEEDHFLRKVAAEIRRAQNDGRLGHRTVFMPYLDPNWKEWSSRLPRSFRLVSTNLFYPFSLQHSKQDPAANDLCGSIFDRVANRRTQLVAPAEGAIQGWITSPDALVISIRLVSSDNRSIGFTQPSSMRSDVDPKRLSGFSLRVTSSDPTEWATTRLHVEDDHNLFFDIPVAKLVQGQVATINQGNSKVYIGVDLLTAPRFDNPWTWRVQSVFESAYFLVTRYAAWALLLLPFFFILLFSPARGHFAALIALLAMTVLARVVFFAILDASAWNGDQPRYTYAVMPLFGILLVVLWAHVAGFVMSIFSGLTAPSSKKADVIAANEAV